jgi:phospho-N-acetylmuramoyl-pentapeptide-transferase
MLPYLIEKLYPWLNEHGMGGFRVFLNAPFRSMLCIPLAFILCLLLGPRLIDWLVRQKIGDNPNFDEAALNDLMAYKKNTPTMGGLLIIGSIVVSVLLLADVRNFYVRMALLCTVYLGALGAVDDWLKLTKARRQQGNKDRQGLGSKEKLVFQVGLGVLLGVFTYWHGKDAPGGVNTTLYFPFFKDVGVPLGMAAFVVLSTVVLTGSSNAVNLTDGLDGLAAGCMAVVSFTFFILAVIIGTQTIGVRGVPAAEYLFLPQVMGAEEMAVVAAALAGACMGFLWFNCYPARVFMGDTGSLALGGLIGYVAIVVRQELMLFLVGGVFVMEAVSVLVQVGWFKYTKRRYGEGRRVLLMAPLHHHFQKKGWAEPKVVVRFWLITAMLSAMALATVKLR